MSQASLSGINIFPIKSTAGLRLSSVWVEPAGLSLDRRFLVTLEDGSMLTARKYPQLIKVSSALRADGLTLSYPGMPCLHLKYADFTMQPVQTGVWSDQFEGYQTTVAAGKWFSEILAETVNLLYLGEDSQRVGGQAGVKVSFADGFPLLVISEASLEALNACSPVQHSMAQFRTNLVVTGTEAFAEDSWKRFRIGDVEFAAIEPCSRCILTTVSPETAEFNPLQEPLATLAKFRKGANGKVHFGQNLIPLNEGTIHEGDVIEVLERKEAETYPDLREDKLLLTCVERETIARDFSTFWLESVKGSPLPEYLPGQHLPLELTIEGEKQQRRYTLSSSPSRPGRYAISVKRVEGGTVSNWLHDHFAVGDTLSAEAPSGTFHLPEQAEEKLLLMSAGSGVTPMMAMLRHLADHQQINDVVFYHQCRSKADIPFMEELKALEDQHSGLTVHIVLSQPDPDWHGHHGRLSHQHLVLIPQWTQRRTCVCGPDGFMKDARGILTRAGLPQSLYHQESFGGGSGTVSETEQSVQISINGEVFEGTNQRPVLEQAESEGLLLPNSCRAGVCGACKVKLESGRVSQPEVSGLMPVEIEQGYVLACCCIPETDVELTT